MERRIALNRQTQHSSKSTTSKLVGPKPFVTGGRHPGVVNTKVIVCGTRTFDDYAFFRRKMDRMTFWLDAVEVIIGSHGQRVERDFEMVDVGADAFGKRWAEYNWWPHLTFWPDWEAHGKAAGPIRNTEMAKHVGKAGWCFAFRSRDGKSPGTDDMINKFKKYGDPACLRVFRY